MSLRPNFNKTPFFAWQFGCLLLIAFVFLGHLFDVIPMYAFERLGMNRDVLTIVIWVLPLFAAFVASRYSERHGWLLGMSYAILLPVLGCLALIVSNQLGQPTDFAGEKGIKVAFKIYFVIGAATSLIGTLAGLALTQR